ncbi:unnamed protein product [Heligmosomoides polygyrus]|uniref:Dolichyl-diphosphooligosaccharide--protein glycosyltransferase subunit 2 n=1 Tax=Heligmosomoides polygyrus TaxID=6339 RepID=A0A3P7XB29_HELPZ|nr:unnamed protein product [Heligmosomoides polygyrus]
MKPIILLVLVFSSVYTVSLNTHWNEGDTKRLSKVLENVLQTKKDNIASLHFAASGLKLLNVAPSAENAKAACEVAKKADMTKLDVVYHASALSGDLPDCALSSISEAQKTIEGVLTASSPNGEKIAQALRSADRLGIKVNKPAFDKLLTAAMKDDSPNNLAWVFNAAALLDKPMAAKYFDKIKNLVSQADEVDKRFLQFDGGLSTTSNAIHGIMSLAEQQGKAPAITKDQLLLFTNYLLSRKHVSTEKSAFHLLSALGVLVNNHQLVPVTVSLQGPVMIERSRPVIFNACNVFGLPVSLSGVRVDIVPVGTTTPVIGNLRINQIQGAPQSYFIGPDKLPDTPGFYNVVFRLESEDKRLIGLTGSSIVVKLSDEVQVDDLKIGAIEKDEVITGSSLASVAPFSKHGKIIAADHTKRLYMSFSVKSRATGNLIRPHQVFVLFKHVDGTEVFYTADVQAGGKYLVDVNSLHFIHKLSSQGLLLFWGELESVVVADLSPCLYNFQNLAKAYKDFEGLSGKYTAFLIVGDPIIRTPLNWPFVSELLSFIIYHCVIVICCSAADFTLTLPSIAPEVVPKSQRVNYDALPEIKHMFRQPEKRPPAVVSDAFTFICLSPLLLLLGLWFRIGLNFGNMPGSIWTLFFHGGLAALFALYFVFWLQLNMFDTLKYLALIGGFTYLAGNRVLKAIADKRKMSLTKNLKSLTSVGPRAVVTWDKAERIRRNEEIWANPDSIVHRLPEHYCKRYWDNLLLIYPPEADKGLWGGEGVVKGWKESRPYTKKKVLPRQWIPRLYFPALKKQVLYSEILDKHMEITVTERTLRLIDQNFGLDYYILRTPEIDLASKLGNRLKREMLLTLAMGNYYPGDEERQNYIKQKHVHRITLFHVRIRIAYAEFVIPLEEADWVGLDLNEAARKQQEIEEQRLAEPLKYKLERELVERLRTGTDLITNEEEFAPKIEESKFGERLLGKYLNPVAKRLRR